MRYDVIIVESETQKVVAITGVNLDERGADRRENTTIGRTNLDRFFVARAKSGRFKKGDTFRDPS